MLMEKMHNEFRWEKCYRTDVLLIYKDNVLSWKKTVGKMKKTGFDIDKEGAAECHLVRLLGELHVQTGIGNAAQGEQKYLTSK